MPIVLLFKIFTERVTNEETKSYLQSACFHHFDLEKKSTYRFSIPFNNFFFPWFKFEIL